MKYATLSYPSPKSLRDLERRAVLDLQCSFRSGNLASEFYAAIRAAEYAFIRESTDTGSLIRKAQILAWAGFGSIPLPVLARTRPLLRTYTEQADDEGERSIALKALALIEARLAET
jgi:hypothetical protein